MLVVRMQKNACQYCQYCQFEGHKGRKNQETDKTDKSDRANFYIPVKMAEVTFPKISRQFFDYFPKLVDTLPNFVDTFLKK